MYGNDTDTLSSCSSCLDNLRNFMQPILDGLHDWTGWDYNFFAGGPEPADNGQLNMIR